MSFSMYETIMELPLFKGIGVDQLSVMLEKTSVAFDKFDIGSIIQSAGNPVKTIDFILQGKISKIYTLHSADIQIKETLGTGEVIGAINLFGISTDSNSEIIAQENVSLMRILKDQYINILKLDNIFLINYLNYLCAAAQRPARIVGQHPGLSIATRLYNLTALFVSPKALSVEISGNDESISKICGIDSLQFSKWKIRASQNNEISITDHGIMIKNSKI